MRNLFKTSVIPNIYCKVGKGTYHEGGGEGVGNKHVPVRASEGAVHYDGGLGSCAGVRPVHGLGSAVDQEVVRACGQCTGVGPSQLLKPRGR